MSVCPRDIGSMRTVRARHPRRGVMLGGKRVNKIAHALSHSGRGRGVRRRETVSVGHDRGRARGRHIYRDAAHGHAAHIAHKRPLRPRRACELSRGGAGGAHTATPCESRGRWGASLARGVVYAARASSMHLSRPPAPLCDAAVDDGRPPAQGAGEGGGGSRAMQGACPSRCRTPAGAEGTTRGVWGAVTVTGH